MRQHTGNWPGKTVTRAEGSFSYRDKTFKLVDLPGTYSLMSDSEDEEVARDFVLFGKPDVTVVVVDAARLERNLSLVLQILEITTNTVLCLNLMDEARRHGIAIDLRTLSRDLEIPVIATSARSKEGISELITAIHTMATHGNTVKKHLLTDIPDDTGEAIEELTANLQRLDPDLPTPGG